jgi:hypothetical protein
MATIRPIGNVAGITREIQTTDIMLHGMEADTSKTITATNGLTAVTLTTRRTILTGTAGTSCVVTLPAAASAVDGQLMSVMSTTGRALVSWSSTGASVTGLPTSMTANTAINLIYDTASLRWFVT